MQEKFLSSAGLETGTTRMVRGNEERERERKKKNAAERVEIFPASLFCSKTDRPSSPFLLARDYTLPTTGFGPRCHHSCLTQSPAERSLWPQAAQHAAARGSIKHMCIQFDYSVPTADNTDSVPACLSKRFNV